MLSLRVTAGTSTPRRRSPRKILSIHLSPGGLTPEPASAVLAIERPGSVVQHHVVQCALVQLGGRRDGPVLGPHHVDPTQDVEARNAPASEFDEFVFAYQHPDVRAVGGERTAVPGTLTFGRTAEPPFMNSGDPPTHAHVVDDVLAASGPKRRIPRRPTVLPRWSPTPAGESLCAAMDCTAAASPSGRSWFQPNRTTWNPLLRLGRWLQRESPIGTDDRDRRNASSHQARRATAAPSTSMTAPGSAMSRA